MIKKNILFGYTKICFYVCLMENKKIKHNGEVIDSARLYTITEYSRTFGVPLQTVKYRVLAGTIPVLKVNGSKLVISEV